MSFDPAALAAFKADAMARWPQEACGFLTPGGYVDCVNVAANPLIDFEIAADAYLEAGEILAVLHSHTHSVDRKTGELRRKPIDAPSLSDQTMQPASGVPWGISCVTVAGEDDEFHVTEPFFFGDELDIPPLVGRPFRWGVADCYALVRDWFRLRGVGLPHVPRVLGWEHEADHFTERFAAAGFSPIDEAEVREGDVALMRVRFDRVNHCGVAAERGLLLDHRVGQLSGRRPIVTARDEICLWLRHESLR